MAAEGEHHHGRSTGGDEANQGDREEYTSYRETRPGVPDPDPEAVREADLQPGSPEAAEEDEEDGGGIRRDPD